MIVTRATPADVDTIMSWRREREAWLAAKGEDQWSIPLPRSAMAATVAAGHTWLVFGEDEPVATITLTGWPAAADLWKPDVDPEPLWHPQDEPTDALYVSKMMVPLARSGSELGAELLDWAGGQAHEAGLTWLRLDSWTTNDGLHAYYVRQGFSHVRTVGTRVSGRCFQRRSRPYGGVLINDNRCQR